MCYDCDNGIIASIPIELVSTLMPYFRQVDMSTRPYNKPFVPFRFSRSPISQSPQIDLPKSSKPVTSFVLRSIRTFSGWPKPRTTNLASSIESKAFFVLESCSLICEYGKLTIMSSPSIKTDSSIATKASRQLLWPWFEATSDTGPYGPYIDEVCWLITPIRDLSCRSIPARSERVRYWRTLAYNIPERWVVSRKGDPMWMHLASCLMTRGTGRLLLARREKIRASESSE